MRPVDDKKKCVRWTTSEDVKERGEKCVQWTTRRIASSGRRLELRPVDDRKGLRPVDDRSGN
jgi:hypothetical protein